VPEPAPLNSKRTNEVIPPQPSYEKVLKEYNAWAGDFSRYCAERFDLSDAELQSYYDNLLLDWSISKDGVEAKNLQSDRVYQLAEKAYQHKLQTWGKNKDVFEKIKQERMEQAGQEENACLAGTPEAICDYIKLVLCAVDYPAEFPMKYQIEYNAENKALILDYQLPSMEDIPKIKEKRFLKTTGESKNIYFKEAELNKLYDEALYKITLRTVYAVFISDKYDNLDLITFNGWVTFRNRANGNMDTSCILSLQCRKQEFLNINLANVDPKECFKSLKGVGSSKLYGLAAVRPILELNKEDKRFVSSHKVDESLVNTKNIAIMPWEEFEHLIRGLFEKEFSQAGAEVKVTRASRDGGVDAVVFHPDPLLGGKIVIQAKRYVNTVELSAVRDLYGTVINEGAVKGILITTADYGPEAYEFAKDKPLTLLNGNNLLHLLEKHGHKSKIDLQEARKFFSENTRNSGSNY
jgi:restriction system protein